MGDCKHFDGEGFCYFFADNRTKDFCENMCEHNSGRELDEEFEFLDYMKREFSTDKFLQDYIETASKKINAQGFCKDKEMSKPCERCILKEKCIIKD